MQKNQISIYNTLSRQKELFSPINSPFVGIYLCGPTVYGDAHLGHARSAIAVDIIVRYLRHLNYKVRYVRNITDVGHLERDADHGDDKIAKQAIKESLEPMEIAQRYTNNYRHDLALLNNISPSIEPVASGHIIEQIEMIQKILDLGFAYVSDGSVYFDVHGYSKNHNYGILSGRILEDLLSGTRDLNGQEEKRSSVDFALWKKASPSHIMKWPSPWSIGYPGWHIECSAMSAKYLGEQFDIHAGGMDLIFPHHECEIAQSQCATNKSMAKYWVHNNMVTINEQKMAKSLGNFITLGQLFSGNHDLLDKAYSPMTLRFFILQAHYRSTLSFSTEALDAANVGYKKLINCLNILEEIKYPIDAVIDIDSELSNSIKQSVEDCYSAMNDDFNTAKVIASLFELLRIINRLNIDRKLLNKISLNDFEFLKNYYKIFFMDVLGFVDDVENTNEKSFLDILIKLYEEAKSQKNYSQVDIIRNQLKNLGIAIQDTPNGVQWGYL